MPLDKWDYMQFKAAFHKKTGLDLERYKDKQMERRILQLMSKEKKQDYKEFYDFITTSPPAMDRFMDYLTINTSEFFRDEQVYNRLQTEIFTKVLQKEKGSVKIWSAGCSIGAEPYTIAIAMDKLNALNRVKIFATDIDEGALRIAQKGTYNVKQLGKTGNDIITKYFQQQGTEYSVVPGIKRVVTFKRHNMLTDPPLNQCHMIFCRNVFIYFKQDTQDFLLQGFANGLNPGGYLVIGSAEYISNPARFGLQKAYTTIYQKI